MHSQAATATRVFTTACTGRVRIKLFRPSDGPTYRHYRNISATPTLSCVSGSNSSALLFLFELSKWWIIMITIINFYHDYHQQHLRQVWRLKASWRMSTARPHNIHSTSSCTLFAFVQNNYKIYIRPACLADRLLSHRPVMNIHMFV